MARNFLRVECDECGNEQVVFSRASTRVECLVCSEELGTPTGGKVELAGQVVEEFEVE
ncbi:MAG: 30S ribosomal protein S27e [Candidatus Nanohaloarchaea archaeon]